MGNNVLDGQLEVSVFPGSSNFHQKTAENDLVLRVRARLAKRGRSSEHLLTKNVSTARRFVRCTSMPGREGLKVHDRNANACAYELTVQSIF